MNTAIIKYFFIVIGVLLSYHNGIAQEQSLNGHWQVKLDSFDKKEYTITLPGTLDDAGIGYANKIEPTLHIATLAHLARKVQYVGKAYYSKTFSVPPGWQSKQIKLILERVLWNSTVWIDDKQVKVNGESLVVPHEFDLTEYIVPGKKQTITICIDNSNIYPGINIYAHQYPSVESSPMAHAYTNHTQIKWNGILGSVSLVAKPKKAVSSVNVFPGLQNKKLEVRYRLNDVSDKNVKLQSFVIDPQTGKKWSSSFSNGGYAQAEITGNISFADKVITWSEFTPKLYHLVTTLQSDSGTDTIITKFGIRELKTKEGDLFLNDNQIFVRGNLECIIFPLKGYPPMQVDEWRTLIKKAKEYGLNLLRFHSWCPPKAAFTAADELGFYFQVELPHWNLKAGYDTAAFNYLHREAERILEAYGNHPSFLFLSLGNELEGDFNKLNDMVGNLKQKDKRHLYSTTTFTFQKEITGNPQPQDDYYVTQWTKKGWVRGQGVFNDEAPGFSKDFSQAVADLKVPLISHEIGQYSVYPAIKEIEKYKGNLLPLNFIAVRNDVQKKGLLPMASSFLNASGKLATLLYKEEIERALKTKGFDGFHLLQLQDFPGQGTALVGLLNAFWQSKGLVTAKEFRQYNSELTPLIRYPKAVYTSNEIFTAGVELANFYKPLNAEVVWEIVDDNKAVLGTGTFGKKEYVIGNCLPVGELKFDLKQVSSAKKLTIELSVKGTTYQNQWSIWVYPGALTGEEGDVLITGSLEEALPALQKGRKVLLCPSPDTLKGITGKFVPVFWSPVHFPDQPGTMGLLIKEKHKALNNFPTDYYSNWQWWDLTIKSKTLNAGTLPDEAIIVRVIDNFVRNQSLTNLFEAKLKTGRLVFCSIDIISHLDKRPQAKQLRYSLLKYMNSAAFAPGVNISEEHIRNYFK
ncbi:glycoside hydrolase family 2 [Niastella caeni]|uniref:Glycoside hydrolase family 2 n=1 Tax=Niastella caeni TaxID=2569763 RepID=A0A4S8HXI8_9BACT|nr:sugar-binding domain-containing protein [Niastella caeni]THU40215.1 glycoside hydrolase family 2 [Niastella caeni]